MEFPSVTLLVTHYNRSSSLERLLECMQKVQCVFGEIVVSDDGSKPEFQEQLKVIQQKYPFRLVGTPVNRGLGNNINKGQDAVTTPYTLYVQEDFIPADNFAAILADALHFMNADPRLDITRFYAYFKYPYLEPAGKGFSRMIFNPLYPGYKKFYQYSDHPHLRRSTFLQKFGRYPEGEKGDVTEYRMMMSFLQHKGQGLFYEKYRDVFFQKNSEEEPSTMRRNYWREARNPFVSLARYLYRHLKLNIDYHFKRYT